MTPTENEWLDRQEYPFEPHFFAAPSGRMHFIDVGQGDPVVFVHGNPSWSFETRNLFKLLSGSFRCLAADHLGFGLSDKPKSFSYLPQDQAANFEAWLGSLNLNNITMVVTDWGGPIGLSYAIRHPDRIRSIVITNTWLWSVKGNPNFELFSGFMGGPVGRFLIRRFHFFATAMLGVLFGDKSKLTAVVRRHFKAPQPRAQDRRGSWVFPKQIIESSAWLDSLWAQRSALTGKVRLIAWGARDVAFRQSELDRWGQEFPEAKVRLFETAGHFVTEEQPEELAHEIRNGHP